MAHKFTYDEDMFNPYTIGMMLKSGKLQGQDLREAYTTMRDVAQKRLKRLGTSEFKESTEFIENRTKFKKLSEMKSEAELKQLTIEVTRFLAAKKSSVQGQRNYVKESIKSLHEHGYTYVNKSNFKDFYEMMEDFRAQNLDSLFDSDDVVELVKVAKKSEEFKKDLQENFNYYIENKQAALSALRKKGGSEATPFEIHIIIKNPKATFAEIRSIMQEHPTYSEDEVLKALEEQKGK